MSDKFSQFIRGLNSPPYGGFDITPSDGDDLPTVTRALNVGVSGQVHVTLLDNTETTLFLQAGAIFPLRVKRVWSDGTTASNLVGLY
ncbi:hypothetical protein AL036_15800 [Salipiger aestuarii]|uniref:Uncharacterized protein n=1 Tax=Salipiger aestuarii TaxID=568098 RepID=A0A327XJS6_9RHOB|nr:hypothetical protein [Salipiger aestuarii]EIE51099.1 hypothetical protein C357_10372 [Citreicella sp. 357]KAA8606135.1 hypothetical protein AL036_15800 [Salipiger aestuarii]KAB2533748.1 hypothetical protein AL035_20635 [Salipiger aestuarii]RAK08196.1 hypothetical protein ATI53_10852 [Salipiger aestuarii]